MTRGCSGRFMFQNVLSPRILKVPLHTFGNPSPGPRKPLPSSIIPLSTVAPRIWASGIDNLCIKERIWVRPLGLTISLPLLMLTWLLDLRIVLFGFMLFFLLHIDKGWGNVGVSQQLTTKKQTDPVLG